MIEKKLTSWDEFQPLIKEIRDQLGVDRYKLPDGTTIESENHILFRGQADANWKMETTLERKTSQRYHILWYMINAAYPVNEIESFTGNRWNLPDTPEMGKEINAKQDSLHVHLPCYEYLVYLRHHGFPSPLLDWTESPYIAAFFAFCDDVKSENIAIYLFNQSASGYKTITAGNPMITVKGPYTTTHSRHFAQKAWYTISTKWSAEDEMHYFCPH